MRDLAWDDGTRPADAVQPSDGARSFDGTSVPACSDGRAQCGGKCCSTQQTCSCQSCITTPATSYGAEANPTGNPIGGGAGYNRIVSASKAKFVVHNKAELLAALGAATAGQIIYLDDQAQIDLTGSSKLSVPAGVTLASGRGNQGSLGALLFTSQHDIDVFPLLLAKGKEVRFTGFRLRGPDPEVGDHHYKTTHRLSRGIQSATTPSFEVDNCELSGWSHAAVYIQPGCTNARVHHNYIHHNRRIGYGYGVSMGYSTQSQPIDVLIEGNLFDFSRHHIASTGNAYGSYEARYNLSLQHDVGHSFDRHGTSTPGSWVGGDGGEWTRIHHNTFWDTQRVAVGIRGKPVKAAEIHHNWFYHATQSSAVSLNTTDNVTVKDNHFGSTAPAVICLPVATATASVSSGSAPLTVTFDGSKSHYLDGTIVSHQWDFGDGTSALGAKPTHVFQSPGQYKVSLTAIDNRGVVARRYLDVTVTPKDSKRYFLDLWIKDSYRGSLTGYFLKQIWVEGTKVWEDDVAGDEGWSHLSLDVTAQVAGRKQATVVLRAHAEKAVTDPSTQVIDLFVFLDDLVLFGGGAVGGDFEKAGGWTFSHQGSTSWKGAHQTGEAHSGAMSYQLSHAYNAKSVAGSWGQVQQVIPIVPLP